LGTTERQYDVLYGLVWGTRVAFTIGLSATLGRMLIGVLLGLISGYYGGLLDATIMRVTDAFMAFPIVPATLLMLTFFGPTLGGMTGGVERIVVLALVLFGWMQYARVVRGNVLAEREKKLPAGIELKISDIVLGKIIRGDICPTKDCPFLLLGVGEFLDHLLPGRDLQKSSANLLIS